MRPFFAILVAAVTSACAQTQDPSARLEFEVASVKPSTSVDNSMSLNRSAGGGLDARNISLRSLITFAYDIGDHQLSGAPAWVDSERYDIAAHVAKEEAAAEPAGFTDPLAQKLRLRMRSLLADRFKLAIHTETREMPVLALVLAKGGPHLAATTNETSQIRGEQGKLTCKKISMEKLATQIIAQRLGRSVVDKTGLSGDFDFVVNYVEEARTRPGPDGIMPTSEAAGPTFVTALQEQLGLKLENQKGPVQFLIVDHVERASAN